MRIAYETMLAEFERVLTKYGFSPERAHEAAEIFAQNSLAGVFSHGLNRFPRVIEYLRLRNYGVSIKDMQALWEKTPTEATATLDARV